MQIVRKARQSRKKSCEALQISDLGQIGRGLAVDIGTTTVAMSLYDLSRGELQGSIQEKNRQTVLGADVMMRLMHCQRGQQPKLQQMIRQQIENMAGQLLVSEDLFREIKKMVVVGNTTMCHIFLGEDTKGLWGSPFRPAYQGAYSCTGSQLDMDAFRETQILVLPGIDAHVGADAVSMATLLEKRGEGIQLAIDLGTNAEMVLWQEGTVTVCSAPAGPAFEGAQIHQGMRGEPGAISSFKIASGTGNILLDVIHGAQAPPVQPRGICGSGLIDCIASLRECGLVTREGYLLTQREARQASLPDFLTERLEPDGFVVYLSHKGEQVVLTREDIRQFQLAKAAVQAGVRILLSHQGLLLSQLDKIYIAGVFGGHISTKNALSLGLFPHIPPGKLEVVGNAAGEGAAKALFSEEFCRGADALSQRAEHLELADRQAFGEEFLASMNLEPWNE